MFSKALHNRWARLGIGILGVLLMAISINLFVVPHNLYTGAAVCWASASCFAPL